MRVLYVGDFIKRNGPSAVDISIRNVLENKVNRKVNFIQSNEGLNFRIMGLFLNSDLVHVSGVSFIGLVLVVLGRILNKKTTFTMHGFLKIESKYRVVPKKRMIVERLLMLVVDRIFPVSSILARDIGCSKTVVIPNGITRKDINITQKDKYLITLIGGGRREKRHLEVCQAIDVINKRNNFNLKVSLFGERGCDSLALEKFDFVDDFGFCAKKKIEESLSNSYIFIQYSAYEPFSLSVADAISYKCKVIASDKVGINEFIDCSECYRVVFSVGELESTIVDMIEKSAVEYFISDSLLTWEQVAHEYLKHWDSL